MKVYPNVDFYTKTQKSPKNFPKNFRKTQKITTYWKRKEYWMLKHKQSGGPVFTFSLPGGDSHPCTTVSYTTVVDLRCMLSLYKNRIFGSQGIRSCKTALVIRMYLTPQGIPEIFFTGIFHFPGCTNVMGCTELYQICAVREQSHSLKHNVLCSSSLC